MKKLEIQIFIHMNILTRYTYEYTQAAILVVDYTNNTASIFWREIENDPLLRVSDANKVHISSHVWVASTTFLRKNL